MATDLFSNGVKKIIERSLGITELFGAAEQLKAAGEPKLAVELYKIWIAHNQNEPLLYAIYFNYGVALSEINDLPAAKDALSQAIAINPDFIPPYINLGTLLEKMGAADQAYFQWNAAVTRLAAITGPAVGHKLMALKQIGRVLEGGGIDEHAESALRQALEISANQRDVIQHYIALRQRQCKWPGVVPWEGVTRATLMASISPLSMAAYSDDPVLQLANAWSYNKHEVGQRAGIFTTGNWAAPEGPRSGSLRVGYLSSDLREHAVGFLTAEIFELHNRDRVEVFAYYCGPRVNDSTQARIKSTVDHWVDIREMDDKQVARKIIDDHIDILIDLNGNTKDARLKLIAMKPAPIIVNWLGFPGTMGSPYHHYIVADDYIIPKEAEIYYTEKVLRLPCYQPNDRKRPSLPQRPTRQEAGLPEDAFVYCCFNGLQKLSRATFHRWLAILRQVPGSVLWLLSSAPPTIERLRQIASQNDVAPERLIFAGSKPNLEHVARYPLADLFLDTSPYGAHTTASDALWMGVPVLTLPGRSFPSRVCGSLVRSMGLPDLICNTADEFVSRAVELGRDRAKTQAYRDKVRKNRDTCDLFNTPKLVDKLEGLYQQMWNEFSAGKLPVPDLSNLDVYQEVGVEEDQQTIEALSDEEYRALYLRKLAYRHSLSPMNFDRRLWSAEVSKRFAP